MIDLYQDPIRATLANGESAMLLGFVGESAEGLILTGEGNVITMPRSEFRIDFRYNVESDQWVDINRQNTAQTDQDI